MEVRARRRAGGGRVVPRLPTAPAQAGIDTQTLGGRYSGSNVNFRVYSSRATRIAVYVYAAATGAQEKASYLLTKGTGDVWAATVGVAALQSAGVTGTVYYGYRAWGPNWPYSASWTKGSTTGFVADVDSAGNRFNPNKLLLDPYAREMSHDTALPDGVASDYSSGPAKRAVDTGPIAPKGMVLAADSTSFGTKPTRAFKDDIVYEVHLRGLTKADTSIATAERGTYKAAGQKAAYLASLGVTAVEFLPLQETQNDANDANPSSTTGDNYWGYMTENYFAPDRRYSYDKTAGGPTREFKAMVKAFHDAGIKVLVDVVYNHTAEGGAIGDKNTYNIFSWRGLDNPAYYSLTSDMQGSMDNTGLGHNYNTRNPAAQNLIVDSVAYWKNTLGVDGYRFDLASVLGNTCQHGCFSYSRTDANTALNRLTTEMPARPAGGGSGVDWIAEPWAIGTGTYQVGNFPAAWSSGTASTGTRCAATRTSWASTRSPRATWPPGSPARRTCTATTAAGPGIRSTSWWPTTGSPRRTCTRATARTTGRPGRTAPRTGAATTTSRGIRAGSRPSSARRPATRSRS
ncbi:alpha-amylase family glycosyl hydrolase [Catellatospora coxensis]